MFAKQKQVRLLPIFIALLATLSLTIAACATAPTPAPTPKPQPTLTLNLATGASQVQAGKSVAIVAKVEPLEKLSLRWSVSGTSGGKLSTDTGDNVIYTAGKEGIDIVVAEGTTASGVPVKQTVTLTVIAPTPTVTPVPPTATPTSTAPVPPTAIPLSPTATPQPTPPMVPPPALSQVTLTTPTEGQTVPCENLARGTFSPELKEDIWPVVYIGGAYHPQAEGFSPASKVGNNWHQTVRFGDCGNSKPDVGKPFQLIIVTANASATAAFVDYLQKAAARNWSGMPELPPGAKESVRIMVIHQ
jgi:hypothetical protein